MAELTIDITEDLINGGDYTYDVPANTYKRIVLEINRKHPKIKTDARITKLLAKYSHKIRHISAKGNCFIPPEEKFPIGFTV